MFLAGIFIVMLLLYKLTLLGLFSLIILKIVQVNLIIISPEHRKLLKSIFQMFLSSNDMKKRKPSFLHFKQFFLLFMCFTLILKVNTCSQV